MRTCSVIFRDESDCGEGSYHIILPELPTTVVKSADVVLTYSSLVVSYSYFMVMADTSSMSEGIASSVTSTVTLSPATTEFENSIPAA